MDLDTNALLLYGYFFIYKRTLATTCSFSNGDVTGPGLWAGIANSEDECAQLVKVLYKTARGVTWVNNLDGRNHGNCWAEFGDRISSSTSSIHRACLFEGMPLSIKRPDLV